MGFLDALKRRARPHGRESGRGSTDGQGRTEQIEPRLRAGTGAPPDRLDPETVQMVQAFEGLYRDAPAPETNALDSGMEENPFADAPLEPRPQTSHPHTQSEHDDGASRLEQRERSPLVAATIEAPDESATDQNASIDRAMDILRAGEAKTGERPGLRQRPAARRPAGRAMVVIGAAVALLIGFGFGYVAGRGSNTSEPVAVSRTDPNPTTRLRLDYDLGNR